MAHELAGALQQAGRIGQRCAVKETHVNMRSEYIDVAEGRISQTGNRTAVMQELPDFGPACSLIQASMAGARSTAPLNRSNSVLIVATLESAGGVLSWRFERYLLVPG